LSTPRLPTAPIAYDFWKQFVLAEELETIRIRRPGAFRALPLEDDAPLVAELGHRA
jgi:hypothetical protein